MNILSKSRLIIRILFLSITFSLVIAAIDPAQASYFDDKSVTPQLASTEIPYLDQSTNWQKPGSASLLVEPPVQVHNEPPLQLTFPTPEPPPEGNWRPPLYEVPWALGPYDHFYFLRPIATDEISWLTESYRYGDYFPDTEIVHTGMDVRAELGTPIVAAAGGKVIWAGDGLSRGAFGEDDPYGLAVMILHDFGINQRQIQTVYAHMGRVDVKVGQRIEVGEQLGTVGTTGFTTGPHLHFEVRLEEGEFFTTRNPELWIAPPEGWGVLAARIMKRDGSPFYHLDVKIRSLETDQTWTVWTYSPGSANSDDYYLENVALSDLPAGSYEVKFRYFWISQSTIVDINPGAVTYLSFQNSVGFSFNPPVNPDTTSPFIPAGE